MYSLSMNALINIYKNHSINSTSSLLRQIYFGVCIEITAPAYVACLSLALSVLIVHQLSQGLFLFLISDVIAGHSTYVFFYWLNVCSESLKERWHVMIFTMNTDNPPPPPPPLLWIEHILPEKKKLHIPPSNSPVLLLGPVPASVMSKIKLFPCLDLFSPPTPTHFTVLHKHPGNTGNILWAIWSPTVSKTPILSFWIVFHDPSESRTLLRLYVNQ